MLILFLDIYGIRIILKLVILFTISSFSPSREGFQVWIFSDFVIPIFLIYF